MATEGHIAFVQEQHSRQLDEINDVLYGDKRLGASAAGLVQNMAIVVKTAERNAERVAEIQATLTLMNVTLEHLKTQSDARQRESEQRDRNRASATAAEVARTLLILMVCSPLFISDWRHEIFGTEAWWVVIILGIALIVAQGIAILSRRNGH